MSESWRHCVAHRGLFTLTAFTLVALAGCAGGRSDEPRAGTPMTTAAPPAAAAATTSTPRTTETRAASASETREPAGSSRAPAAAYAVIDGNKEAVPAIRMGDPATVARIINEGKSHNQVMDHLTYISTKIGPRLTGSSNAETANKWTRDQFERWGLAIPAFSGANGQTSTDRELRGLWQWGEISARFDRGPSTGKVLAPRNPGSENPEYRTVRDLEFTTQAWTAGTNGAVRGEVIKLPSNDEQFEAAKDRVKGSWILLKANQSGRRGITGRATASLQSFAEIRKRWKTGEEAKEAPPIDKDLTHYEGTLSGGPMPDGAPFSVDVKLTDPSAVTGTVSFGGFRTTEFQGGVYNPETHELKFKTESARGTREYLLTLEGDTLKGKTVLPDDGGTITYSAKKVTLEEPKKGPTIEERLLALEPAGWISPASSDLVITGGASGWDKLDPDAVTPDIIVTVRQSDYDCMNSRLADGAPVFAEFDLKHTFTKGPIPVYDTIAEIRGTEKPDEVVIVSGHLDSWNGPSSQGTTDNGTGSAVTLEAARILTAAKAKPKRTIRFILWTGEEQGLLGSAAYVKRLKETGELEKISVVLVDDGGTNWEGGLGCVESMVPYLATATAPVNGQFFSEADQKFMDVNIRRQKTFSQISGSDHYSFCRERVPGFFWDETGRADYNHTHHTQYDRIDQAIPEYLQQSSTCAAVTAYNLACAPEFLPRPTEEEWPARGGQQRRPRDGNPGRPPQPNQNAGGGSGN